MKEVEQVTRMEVILELEDALAILDDEPDEVKETHPDIRWRDVDRVKIREAADRVDGLIMKLYADREEKRRQRLEQVEK